MWRKYIEAIEITGATAPWISADVLAPTKQQLPHREEEGQNRSQHGT